MIPVLLALVWIVKQSVGANGGGEILNGLASAFPDIERSRP